MVEALRPADERSLQLRLLSDLIDEVNAAVTAATGYPYPTVFLPGEPALPTTAPAAPRLLVRLLQRQPFVEVVDEQELWP
jgi:hypothetical protein